MLRVINDASFFPKVEHSLAISASTQGPSANGFVFILPRNDATLLLGGIAQSHDSTLNLLLDSSVIKRMRARCEKSLPALKDARLDDVYPLA
ncbi:MAG: hypothetical protein EOO38_19320 [Cytophagaceae bacterium]|nr:MAG: hypothetical protein EOO38_19320 [Cytophagaceae bacterium]